ncbi:hypothetical protein DBR32_00630 [Taibaiella sp. KBW10]|uniref:LVIVD repeat-containing protein n=1 Tax=Taibaiella sp. KBW10 TaxID=2153357 RepID=UPI000F59D2A5|nr:hypothetical protein [Taibaiella sp. KBW10]RQO32152.1 hypothetical protein DBR32_00630 [Taibaiella sp. KBW10]
MKKILYYTALAFCAILLLSLQACEKSNLNTGNSGTGTGGSLARFTISGNYLYIVDHTSLKTYNITNPNNPVRSSTQYLNNDIETIYPYRDKLFIGSQSAMYIYSLSNPAIPVFESNVSHVRACDPVVAKDNYAYVTVRSGSTCGGVVNALMVYEVGNNMEQPILHKTIDLEQPYGLGISHNTLYVCDANKGLKIFDISSPQATNSIGVKTGYKFYDCIPYNDVLVCMVEGGMVVYDITNPRDPVFVAKTF